MKSQNEQILTDLKKGKKITSLGAFIKYDCLRLAARIYDLSHQGHKIKTTMISEGGKRFASYELVQ